MRNHPTHLVAELVTREKKGLRAVRGKSVRQGSVRGVDRIDRVKMRAFQPVDKAVDLDGASFTVDSVQQTAMIHLPFWVAVDGLPSSLNCMTAAAFSIRATVRG